MSIQIELEKRSLENLYISYKDIKAKLENAKLKLIEAQDNLSNDPRTETELAKRIAVVNGFKYQIGKVIDNIELNTQYLNIASVSEQDDINAIKLDLINNQ